MGKCICDRWDFDPNKRFYVIYDYHGKTILVTVERIGDGDSMTQNMHVDEFQYKNARKAVIFKMIRQLGIPALNKLEEEKVLKLN